MSDLLFGRVARLQVDTLLITDLRITFNVELTSTEDPNKCKVTVTNLSADTRAQLSKLPSAHVVLEAGYTDTLARLFSGDVRRPTGIQHEKSGPDWVTTIECGDGEEAYRAARFTGSFAPGTPVADVARAIAKSFNIPTGNLDDAMAAGNFRQGIQTFSGGYSARGRASTQFRELMDSLGLESSIQDGKLQVLKPTETLKGKAVLLSKDTGMVGSPSYDSGEGKKKVTTLKVKSLLQPAIRPGVQLRVESEQVKGAFKVQTVVHAGDTHGGEWTSECKCLVV